MVKERFIKLLSDSQPDLPSTAIVPDATLRFWQRDSWMISLSRHRLEGWLRSILLRLHVEALVLVIPILVLILPIRRLLEILTPKRVFRLYHGMAPDPIAAVVARRLRHPWLMRRTRCLRQGLVDYHLMRLAGIPAELHFAVYPFDQRHGTAHCWVVSQGVCWTAEPARPFAVVLIHPEK
jgi:hypothetical protein